jgi:glycosyltransferase involved in cell wall biosynthesis
LIKNKLVSICMAVFNGEKYLSLQLESLINQSYSNMEIIIVNDCSDDGTDRILKNFSEKHDFIKVYKNKENIGFIKNFEKAISLANGDYIALADQDDIWAIDKLEILINMIKNTDSLLVYSNALLVDSNLESQNKTLFDTVTPMCGDNNLYFLYNNSISGNTMMFKKELREKALPFPNHIYFHDIWISFIAASNSKIRYFNKNLVSYRQHSDNITNIGKQKNKKNYRNKIAIKLESHKNFYLKLHNYIEYLEKNIPDHKNLPLLKELYKEYSNFDKCLFNIKLFKNLYRNKDKLFFSKKKVGILKIFKMSVGIRFYKLLPFI